MSIFTLEDGQKIKYFKQGQAQDQNLVLVHGWTSGPHIWQDSLPLLEKDFHIHMWHARAHSELELSDGSQHNLEQLAKDLKYFLEQNEITDPIIVGHSMGAMLCWEFIEEFGDKDVKAWLFIDQSPCLITKEDWPYAIYGNFTEEQNQQHIRNMKENFSEACLQLAANGLNSNISKAYQEQDPSILELKAYLASLNSEAMISYWESFSRKDWRPTIKKISKAVALIYGSNSQFYLPEVSDYIASSCNVIEKEIIEGAHHSPQLSKPEEFNKSFQRLLKTLKERA